MGARLSPSPRPSPKGRGSLAPGSAANTQSAPIRRGSTLSWVLPEHRRQGLSKWLMRVILAHSRLQGFRRWVLSTKDAHGLYERFGFIKLNRPERWMERPDPKMKESPDYWNPK